MTEKSVGDELEKNGGSIDTTDGSSIPLGDMNEVGEDPLSPDSDTEAKEEGDVAWLMAPVGFPESLSLTERTFHQVRALAFMVATGISKEGGSWPNVLEGILLAETPRTLALQVLHIWAQCVDSDFLEDWTKEKQLQWIATPCMVLMGLDEKVLTLGDALVMVNLCLRHLTTVFKEELWCGTIIGKAALNKQMKICKKVLKLLILEEESTKSNPFAEKAHDMTFRCAGIRGVGVKTWQIVWEESEGDEPWASGVNIHRGVAENIAITALAAIPEPASTVGAVAAFTHRVLPNTLEGHGGRVAGSVVGVGGSAKAVAVGSVAVLHHHLLAGSLLVAGGPVVAVAAGAGLGYGAMVIGKKLLGPNAQQEAFGEAEKVWVLWRDRSPLRPENLPGNCHRLLGWNNMKVDEDVDVIEAMVEPDTLPKGSVNFELITADHISWTKEIVIMRQAVISDEASAEFPEQVKFDTDGVEGGKNKGAKEEEVASDAPGENKVTWERLNSHYSHSLNEIMTCKDDVHKVSSRTFRVDEFPDGIIGIEIRKAKWLGVVQTIETRPIVAADVDGCTLRFIWLKVSPVDM